MGASGCAVASMPSCSPCSMRDRLRRSSTSASSRSACAPAMRRNRLPLEPRYRRRSSIVSTNPLMAVIGVRSSCETLATKSCRSRSSRCILVASVAQSRTSRPSPSGTRLTRMWITASGTRSPRSPAACSEAPARTGARMARSDGADSASAKGRPTCSGRTPSNPAADLLATLMTPPGSIATTASGSSASSRSTLRALRTSAMVAPASRRALTAAVRARARHHAITPSDAPSSAIDSRPAQRPSRSSGSSSATAMPAAATATAPAAAATGMARPPGSPGAARSFTRACGSRRRARSPGATPRRPASCAGRR